MKKDYQKKTKEDLISEIEKLQKENKELKGRAVTVKDSDHQRKLAEKYIDIAGTILVVLNSDQSISKINQKGCDLLQVSEEVLEGGNWFDSFVPDEDREGARSVFDQLMKGEVEPTEFYENNVLTTKGELKLIAWHNSILRNTDGEIIQTISSGEDITEKRKAELTLKKSNAKLLQAQNMARLWNWEYDAKTNMITFSENFASLTKNQIPQILDHQELIDMLHPDDKDFYRDYVSKAKEREGVRSLEFRIILPDGDTKYIKSFGLIKSDDKGELVSAFGTDQDITETKSKEKELEKYRSHLEELVEIRTLELEKSQHLLKTVTAEAPVVMFMLDAKGYFTFSDGKGLENLGLKPGEVVGLSVFDVYKDFPEILDHANKALQGEEIRSLTVVGDIYYDTLYQPVFNTKEKLEQVVGIAFDVSDEIKMRQALAESEIKFKTLYENAPDMHVSVSPDDAKIKYCNRTLLKNTGYQEAEIIGQSIFKMYAEECLPQVEEAFKQFVEKGKVKDKELILKRKDGTKIDVSLNVEAVHDKHGKILYSMSSWRDISLRKQAQRELVLSEERYTRVIEASNTGIWDWNLKENIVYFSPRWKGMLGYKDHEVSNEFKSFENLLHPDDRESLLKELAKFLKKPKGDFKQEFRLKQKNGSYKWIINRSSIKKDEDGKPAFMSGSHLDIDDQKNYQNILELSQKKFQGIFNAVADGLFIADLNANIIEVNVMAQKLYGYSKQELTQLKQYELIHPDYHQIFQNFKTAIEEKQYFEAETVDVRKDGSTFNTIVKASLVNFEGQAHVLAIVRDVTHQKNQEEEIRRNNQLNGALLELYEANQLQEKDFIQLAIDKAVELSESTIGYFHFFDEQINEIELVAWSTGTFTHCSAIYDKHYPVEKAGVWADAVRFGKPVIINDYATFNNKKGMPEGHFPLINHLGVPVFDGKQIVAIIGIGNKKTDYVQEDIDQLEIFTRSIWEIIKGKRAAQQIKSSEEKYRLLFENMNEGFAHASVITNERGVPVDWRYIDVNPAFETQTGLKRKDVIGKLATEILPGVDKDSTDWIYQYGKVALSGGEKKMEEYSGPLGRWLGVHVFSPRLGEFAATYEDITRRKEAQEQLRIANELTQRYNKELENSNRELEQFAYVSSHDLQEPLRKIKNYTELLESNYLDLVDENGKNYLHIITKGVSRMQSLIDDLLEYSRVTTRAAEFSQIRVSDVIANVIDCLELPIVKSSAEITTKGLREIQGDESQIFQLFLNLLSNALKFKGIKKPKIEIIGAEKKTHWQFAVKDNGIGMDMLYAEKIFTVFQRLHARSQYDGTGIGLAICKKIVERHKGEIWVKSTLSKGSTFYFTIQKKL